MTEDDYTEADLEGTSGFKLKYIRAKWFVWDVLENPDKSKLGMGVTFFLLVRKADILASLHPVSKYRPPGSFSAPPPSPLPLSLPSPSFPHAADPVPMDSL